jgi:inosine-uridine nucleoside N-ribohydrolase
MTRSNPGRLQSPAIVGDESAPPRLILDTDYRTDVDDPGTLAMIHALQTLAKVKLIGVLATTDGASLVGAIDAVNTYYGRGDIPIGLIAAELATAGGDPYGPTLANTRLYPSRQTNATAPDATVLYRRLLHQAPDQSVKILVIGGQNGIDELMRSKADHRHDGIDRTGMQLIREKVSELVIMGGDFSAPDRTESNIRRGAAAAQRVAADWPTPVVYSGWELGSGIMTGAALSEPLRNPVARAYELFGGSGPVGTIGDRDSWDQTAALYAVAGLTWEGRRLWSLSEPQEISFTDDGCSRWTPSPASNRCYLIQEMPNAALAGIISHLMTMRPADP